MSTLVDAPIATNRRNSDASLSDFVPLPTREAECPIDKEFIIKTDILLGEGSYSTVFEAVDKATNDIVVAKITDLTRKTHSHCHYNEVASFKLLEEGHPNIVRFYYDVIQNGVGVIIMEKLTSVTLEDFIATYGRMGVTEALEIFQQIVVAVAYMHDKNLSPRDLKPENIAYDFEANHAKIFDLGLALRLPVNSDGSSPLTSVTTGSPLYMAPEVIGNKPHDTFAHDIWCLGQVLYYMVVGQSPFQWCHTLAELRDELLVFRKIKYPSWLDFNTTLLLKGMLDFDPTLRLEIGQVIESVEELLVATRR